MVRWRLWRERSAWARGARSCRRWRSATGRRGGRRRDGSSTSCARRRAGIASMRCGRSGNIEPVAPNGVEAPRKRRRKYGATIKDALTALWEASDRVCGKRLKVMIPTLLPALEQHGRLKLGSADRELCSRDQRSNDRPLLVDVKVAASRRQAPSRRLLLRHPARSPDPHVQ